MNIINWETHASNVEAVSQLLAIGDYEQESNTVQREMLGLKD